MLATTLVVAASLLVGQDVESPAYEHLKELECFIGNWEGESIVPESSVDSEHLQDWAGMTVHYRMNVRWAPNMSAQIVEEVHEIPGEIKITSTHLRGWDVTAKKFAEHSFTTHKGVWSGTCDKQDGIWVMEYIGFNLDGKKCTGRREVRVVDKDTLAVKDTGQTVDGRPFPDVEFQYKRSKAPQISNYERLKGLEFLIGDWKSKGDTGGTTSWTFNWTEGKNGIQNVLTGRRADGTMKFSNIGVFAVDPGDRRITNWCVNEKGKQLRFKWAQRADGKWENWPPGSTTTWTVTPVDENTWKIEGSGGTQVYRRIEK